MEREGRLMYIFTVRDCDGTLAYEDESREVVGLVAEEYAKKYPQYAPYTVHFEKAPYEDDPRGE